MASVRMTWSAANRTFAKTSCTPLARLATKDPSSAAATLAAFFCLGGSASAVVVATVDADTRKQRAARRASSLPLGARLCSFRGAWLPLQVMPREQSAVRTRRWKQAVEPMSRDTFAREEASAAFCRPEKTWLVMDGLQARDGRQRGRLRARRAGPAWRRSVASGAGTGTSGCEGRLVRLSRLAGPVAGHRCHRRTQALLYP
eukprot:scaffold840_cov350-Prasinococcus_capsulatus_cf.AAC.2